MSSPWSVVGCPLFGSARRWAMVVDRHRWASPCFSMLNDRCRRRGSQEKGACVYCTRGSGGGGIAMFLDVGISWIQEGL